MRTKLLYIALLCSTFAYGGFTKYYNPTKMSGGNQYMGPWIFEDVANEIKRDGTKLSFNSMKKRYSWDPVSSGKEAEITYQVNDGNGLGFYMHCRSSWDMDFYGVYSLYSHSESVPAYTCKRLTWSFKLHAYSDHHPQNVALYARTSFSEIKSLAVDFTADYSNRAGSAYRIGDILKITGESYGAGRRDSSALQTHIFNFDNSTGASTQSKTWLIMLTHCAESTLDVYTNDIFQWGTFKDYGYSWETLYYKYVTFDANGGDGEMDNDTIVNSGTLPVNAFSQEGYVFAGWALEPDGPVVYADGAAITANEFDKGPVTLYAVWNEVYAISYRLHGGTATNPAQYTVATETFTLNNPTREGSTFLGWTGANGSTPQTEVSIANGSTGDKTFTANWSSDAATNALALIDAIGEVSYPGSKTAIDAARAAYDALTDGEKADIPATKFETLLAAEATYAANEQSTIRFMEQDGQTQVGDDQQKAIYYPALPAGATEWQSVEKDVTDKTIVIKAVE